MSKFKNVAFAALTTGAVMLAGQGIATATTGNTVCTTTSGVTTCIQVSQVSASTASDKVSDFTAAASKAVANANNLIAMHLVFNEKAALKANKCFWDTGLNGGYWIGYSGYTFERPKNNKPIYWCYDVHASTHYIKIGGGDDGEDCHNAGIPDHRPKRVKHPFIKTGLKTVMKAATGFLATATSTSTSKGSASAHASSHNADNSCMASADATESSYGYAYAKATAFGSTKSSAIVSAKGKLVKVILKEKTHTAAEGQAKTNASTKASGAASAKASCTPTPNCPTGYTGSYPNCQPPTCTPPSTGTPPNCTYPQPVIVSLTKINDVPAGGTNPNTCAGVNIPGTDTATVSFSASVGTFDVSTFTASGMSNNCPTYIGPNDPTSGTLSATYTVSVRDNQTGAFVTMTSDPFPVNEGAQGGRPGNALSRFASAA